MCLCVLHFFFFNDTATTEIYTLSLHELFRSTEKNGNHFSCLNAYHCSCRSEEHTSELQSRLHLVCRLLLEKKKTQKQQGDHTSHKQSARKRSRETPRH